MGETTDQRSNIRSKWVSLRVSPEEHASLLERSSATTCHGMSDYLRRVLFNMPVSYTFRNRSMDDFMEELILLRSELNAIGNNFNQVVRKINSVKEIGSLEIWLKVAQAYQQELLDKINHIQLRIDQYAGVWLQE